jgi:hypothetical protein
VIHLVVTISCCCCCCCHAIIAQRRSKTQPIYKIPYFRINSRSGHYCVIAQLLPTNWIQPQLTF